MTTAESAEHWKLIHAERARLLGVLEDLSPEQFAQRSLCDGWSVEEVVAHLSAAANTGRWAWIRSIIRSGFRPRQAQRTPAVTVSGTLTRGDRRKLPRGGHGHDRADEGLSRVPRRGSRPQPGHRPPAGDRTVARSRGGRIRGSLLCGEGFRGQQQDVGQGSATARSRCGLRLRIRSDGHRTTARPRLGDDRTS
jgi:hypothetical protein